MTGILTRRGNAETETHRDNSIWQQRKRLEWHSCTDLLRMPASCHVPLESELEVPQLCLTLCDPMDYSPWNPPGQNTGVSSLSLLQGIFRTQGSNPCLPHCRQILYQLSHKGSPWPSLIKITMRYHITLSERPSSSKNLQINAKECVEKREPSCIRRM